MGKVYFQFTDATDEKSSATFYVPDADAATWDLIQTNIGDLTAALQGITLGNITARRYQALDDAPATGPATDPWAQRELKMLLRYQDNATGEVYQQEIPTPDLGVLTLGTGDTVVLADGGPMAAFVSEFEANNGTPDDPDANVTVLGARIVGRNI